MKKPLAFRKLLKENRTIVMPGSYDALSARVVEWAGFGAVYMSGASAAAAVLGGPDLGFMTMSEMVTQAKNIASAVDIPVISDADTGYGDALIITRTVREFQKAGVAGIHLEDLEKHQCGLHTGKTLISTEEMVGRVKAANESLEDENFVLIARTDAIGAIEGGVDEAIERAKRYIDAGADVIWVQEPPVAMQTDEIFEKIAQSIKGAQLMAAAGLNEHPISKFEEWGYKIVFYPVLTIQVVIKAIMDLMTDTKERGREEEFAKSLPVRGVSFEEFMEFTGFYQSQDQRLKFMPK